VSRHNRARNKIGDARTQPTFKFSPSDLERVPQETTP
jgi:hypothetical protein